MNTPLENVTVMGAGAIGMLLGAYLQIGGMVNASLIGHDPYMRAIKDAGLKIEFPDGHQTTIEIPTYTHINQLPEKPDWIVFTVRTYQTHGATREIVDRFGKDIPIVTFQNGYAVRDIQSILGDYAIGGETLLSSKIVQPGFIRQPQKTGLYIGEMSGHITSRIEHMRDSFESVRNHFDCMEAYVTDNIDGAIWAKLAVNGNNNTLTAVTDLTIKELYETYQTQVYSYHLIRETFRIAESEHIDAYNTPVSLAKAFRDHSSSLEDWRAYLVGRAPTLAPFKLSMADMIEKGLPTEVDHINGYIVERAHAHGISVPYHEALVDAVHKIERKEIKPGLGILPKIWEE